MDIDFTTALLSLAACMGAVLLVGRLAERGAVAVRDTRRLERWLAHMRALFPIVVAVVLIRAFVFEPFRIPSASMLPGLMDGDFILVDKFSYGLRLPLLHTKILPIGSPRRGDVIVFRLPSDPSIDYIKRLVGLPGDRIVVRNNRVSINGRWQAVEADGDYTGDLEYEGSQLEIERFADRAHVIMLAPDRLVTDFSGIVPAGQYFFMGDNRNDSQDSRFPQVGFVPDRNLIGRARLIWLSWRVPGWPRLARIGKRIQ